MSIKAATSAPADPHHPLLSDPANVGLRIRYARMVQGMTLKKLAKPVGIDSTSLGNWELGKMAIRGKGTKSEQKETMRILAETLNVNQAWLEKGTLPMTRSSFSKLQDHDVDEVFESIQAAHKPIKPKRPYKKSARTVRQIVAPKDETSPRLKGKGNMYLRFRFWRDGLNLDQFAACELLDSPISAVRRWESRPGAAGSRDPREEIIDALAKKMDVRPEWLRDGTLPMSANEEAIDPLQAGPSGMAGEDKIGDRIRYARSNFTDLTQNALGKTVGFGSGAAWQWESGNAQPRKGIVKELARILTVTPRWLKFGEGPMRAPIAPEKVIEEPVAEEPVAEEPVVEEPVVEAARLIADPEPEVLPDEESPAAKYFIQPTEPEPAPEPQTQVVVMQGEFGGYVQLLADQYHAARGRLEAAQAEVDELAGKMAEAIRSQQA